MNLKIFSRINFKAREKFERQEKRMKAVSKKKKRRKEESFLFIYLVFQVKARQGSTKVSKKVAAAWNRCLRRIAPATTVHLARDALETNRSHYLSR